MVNENEKERAGRLDWVEIYGVRCLLTVSARTKRKINWCEKSSAETSCVLSKAVALRKTDLLLKMAKMVFIYVQGVLGSDEH